MAVLGTPDPGGTPGSEDCNTSSFGPELTSERESCVSRWGHHDMVGNLWEWVADWGDDATDCTTWWSTFGDDRTCVGLGEGDPNSSFPGALIRGGDQSIGTDAGPFAVDGRFQPAVAASFIGFRGAR